MPIVDTIVAPATAAGTSAVALIRVSGPGCVALYQSLWGALPSARRAVHRDYKDREGVLLDDVLVTFFAGPASFSGEDTLEISCHGNPYIIQRILDDLGSRGTRPAGPGEFTQRAFLHGRLDLSQAEAVMDIIRARSDRALAVAQQQLRGALGRHLTPLNEALLLNLARVEAYIDFPEENLPPEDRRQVKQDVERVAAGTTRLLATHRYGELLREGVRTVIVGAPNAGKSSLLNRLVGFERALVSAEPGTTRDFIEEPLRIGGHALRLIDTAGLNPAPGELERRGMEMTRERIENADLLLWVVDGAGPLPAPLPPAVNDRLLPERTLIVLNKSDLGLSPAMAAWREQQLGEGFSCLAFSAQTGAGLKEFEQAVTASIDRFQITSDKDLIAINARHSHALERAQEALHAATQKLAAPELDALPAELLASDLRSALEALGEISGRFDHERMLDQLFAHFCIGK